MPKHWWQRRWGRIVVEFDVLCGCFVISILAVPAIAATEIAVPFTNTVINLGDVPPWIMAGVVLVTWWEARAARKEAKTLGVKIDGMLVDRDKAKVKEGEAKGAQAGEDKAAALAEGQRQGLEMAKGALSTEPNRGERRSPLPVADNRTAKASERVADATERSASAAARVADAAEKPAAKDH